MEEMPLDAPKMSRHGTPHGKPSILSDDGIATAPIIGTGLPPDQPGLLHTVHQAGNPAPAQQETLRQGLHSEAALGCSVQMDQDVVPGQGQTLLLGHFPLQGLDHGGVSLEKSPPRFNSLLVDAYIHNLIIPQYDC
jgi:hypothetical protein